MIKTITIAVVCVTLGILVSKGGVTCHVAPNALDMVRETIASMFTAQVEDDDGDTAPPTLARRDPIPYQRRY